MELLPAQIHGDELLAIARAGGVFLGGLLSALLIFIWYTRRNNLPTWSVADAAAPGVAKVESHLVISP